MPDEGVEEQSSLTSDVCVFGPLIGREKKDRPGSYL